MTQVHHILLAFTRMDAYRRLLWLVVAVAVPVVGPVAAILAARNARRRGPA